MTARSDWCAHDRHDACTYARCGCACHCHDEDRETGSTTAVSCGNQRGSKGSAWDNGRTNQNDPGPAALTAGSSQGLAELDWSSTDD